MQIALARPFHWRWIVICAAWGVLVALYGVVLYRHFTYMEWGDDVRAYWTAWPDLYDAAWHTRDSYVYSPVFAQAFYPLSLLPWEVIYPLWTAGLIVSLIALTGPILAAALLVLAQPVYQSVAGGGIDLPLAIVLALGFRYPAAWALVLLTKITPGVGLLWFAVRREWRPLAWALGVTAALALVSLVATPTLWREWIELLVMSPDAEPFPNTYVVVTLPLAIRLVAAALIVTWGALTDRPWTVLVAAFVAAPLPTSTHATMLLGLLPLLGWGPLGSDKLVEHRREQEQRTRRAGLGGDHRELARP